jgi:hypothetical protein
VQAQQAFAREALEKLQRKMQRKNKGAWKDELEKVSCCCSALQGVSMPVC